MNLDLIQSPLIWIVLGAAIGIVALLILKKSKSKKPIEKIKAPSKELDIKKELEAKKSIEPIIEPIKETVAPTKEPKEELPKVESKKVEPPKKAITLQEAMKATRSGFWGRIKTAFSKEESISEHELESVEEVLYTSDLGPKTVQRLVEAIEDKMSGNGSNVESLRAALKNEMLEILSSHKKMGQLDFELGEYPKEEGPVVWMIVGVNGAGKTTTIGKLSHRLAQKDKKVLIGAGDTFRAAASEQLEVWSQRANVEFFSPEGVTSPSAVAFDACKKAQAQEFDVLLLDTAGRLHTQDHLMDELKKMKRVVEKSIPGAPHEVLLVVDANAGQNALIQAQEFNNALGLTGVILTKLDGTAKGGVAFGVAHDLGLPIRVIGIGEGVDDLKAFTPTEFVESII